MIQGEFMRRHDLVQEQAERIDITIGGHAEAVYLRFSAQSALGVKVQAMTLDAATARGLIEELEATLRKDPPRTSVARGQE
jgi:hypothetical protein